MRVRITKNPLKKYQFAGQNNCGAGYKDDGNGNCIPDDVNKFNTTSNLSGPAPIGMPPALTPTAMKRQTYNILMGINPVQANPGTQLNATGTSAFNYTPGPIPANPVNQGMTKFKTQPVDPNLKFTNQNPIFGDVKNLQNTFNTGSAKDIKSGISSFNETYGRVSLN